MATNDVQNQQLAEYFQLLGCPVVLSPEQLQKLNTPSMRAVWRHLQSHVKPVRSVCTIKNNLLLAELKTSGSLHNSKSGNFKIETVQEVAKMKEHAVTQEKILLLTGQIRTANESLLSANSCLTTKLTKKEILTNNLEELKDKLALLNLKSSCVKNNIEKLETMLEIALILKIRPVTQLSHLDLKENKLLVAKFVQQFSSVENVDDYIVDLIVKMSEFSPLVVYDGILSVSNHALRTLNCCKTGDVWPLPNHPKKTNSLPFSNHLKDLNAMIFKNELDLQNRSRRIVASKAELDNERAALSKVIANAVNPENNKSLILVEIVDNIVENTLLIKKDEKLTESLDELKNACFTDLDSKKCTLNTCKEIEESQLNEVNKRLSDINNLIDQIFTVRVSFVKDKVLQRTRNLVSKCLKLKKNNDEENQCEVLASEDLIMKEVEMFLKMPVEAMTRQWEDSLEIIPKSVKEDILKNPELNFLCQSETKNLIKTIVEKTFWLHKFSY